jgi:BsuBI/PstI restriction endonuclease HTH domain
MKSVSLPRYIDRAAIHQRLQLIFPEGIPQRNYCVREAAASTIFTALYVGAVEDADQWGAPKQIYRMTDAQSTLRNDSDRTAYVTKSLKPRFQPREKTWYQDNSREQIRDETIRQGLIPNNAITERADLPTISAKPRYALRADFAALFDPALPAEDLAKEAESWRERRGGSASAHPQRRQTPEKLILSRRNTLQVLADRD